MSQPANSEQNCNHPLPPEIKKKNTFLICIVPALLIHQEMLIMILHTLTLLQTNQTTYLVPVMSFHIGKRSDVLKRVRRMPKVHIT